MRPVPFVINEDYVGPAHATTIVPGLPDWEQYQRPDV